MSSPIDQPPMVALPGMSAISRVMTPNPVIATIVLRLRPAVSAKLPKIAAPIGRAIRVAANTIADSTEAVVGSSPIGSKYAPIGARTSTGR